MSGVGGLEGWSWIFVRLLPLPSSPPFTALRIASADSSHEYMQILEGIATVLVGVLAAFGALNIPVSRCVTLSLMKIVLVVLVDFPATASFLTPEERAYILWKKSTWPRDSHS
jgi:hypothetical protein